MPFDVIHDKSAIVEIMTKIMRETVGIRGNLEWQPVITTDSGANIRAAALSMNGV